MKSIKLILLTMFLLTASSSLMAQIQATTSSGDKVLFNGESGSWEYADKAKKSNKSLAGVSNENIKSFSTKRGEITVEELKALYLSQAPDDEITKIVDQVYAKASKCNCIVCHWPSHCTWGSDCSHQRNVPCSWCCN